MGFPTHITVVSSTFKSHINLAAPKNNNLGYRGSYNGETCDFPAFGISRKTGSNCIATNRKWLADCRN